MKVDLQNELICRYPNFFRKPGKRLITALVTVQLNIIWKGSIYDKFAVTPESGDDLREYLRDDLGPFDQRGVECDDGWFAIIDRLSQSCEKEIDDLIAQGVAKESWLRIAQIKEKFGGLRFYIHGTVSDELRAQIEHAEFVESFRICEQCGGPGEVRQSRRWSHTFCDACEAEYMAERESAWPSREECEQQLAKVQAMLDARAA